MPPPAKVKQSRKLVAVRRSHGVHDDDGDVVLAEAGEADKRVRRRRADRGRTEERAWQLFRNATLLTTSRGEKHFFILEDFPSLGESLFLERKWMRNSYLSVCQMDSSDYNCSLSRRPAIRCERHLLAAHVRRSHATSLSASMRVGSSNGGKYRAR